MPASFFRSLSKQSLESKVFFAIIAIAILARIFVLFSMPDPPLTDTLHHFTISKYIIENHSLPFQGIPAAGVADLPVPLYHIVIAMPFVVLGIPFSLEAARLFPFFFSFLQLLLAFLLLKRIFPKHWHYGFAFVAVHPFLVIFAGLNYLETFASVFVLLCFFVYWRFVETGRTAFLIVMPFALAGMALSKESATILVPAFFFAFLFELWKKRPAQIGRQWLSKAAFFVVASVLLCSAWFLASFAATGELSLAVSTGLGRLGGGQQLSTSFESIFLLPLNLNSAFWFFLSQGFGKLPFAVSPELAFTAFSLVTFPLLMLLLYGLAKGLKAREKHSFLLLFCLVLASVLLASRAKRFIHFRLFLPVLPLLGIAFCTAFKEMQPANWRKLFAFLFLLAAIYSIAFSSLYAMHFSNDYNAHVPLYEFVKGLPSESRIAIHPDKTRQIQFISGKEPVSFARFQNMDAAQLKEALGDFGATHLAATCHENPWDMQSLEQLSQEGFLQSVFQDSCSTVYEVKG